MKFNILIKYLGDHKKGNKKFLVKLYLKVLYSGVRGIDFKSKIAIDSHLILEQ